MKASILFGLIIVFGLSINNYADEMHILMHDDTTPTINLSDIVNISFEDSATVLRINMSSGTSQNYTLSEIRKLTFGDLVGSFERAVYSF